MKAMRIFFFLLCVSVSFTSVAQEFGGNPPSIKWKQVNNKAARVIFPTGLDSIAKEVAAITERLNTGNFFSIGQKQRKISIVLQNQSTLSNAYVALGPFRSEFYLTPQQNSFSLGSLPWHQQLAIHEFRHVQQNNNFNIGLSKAFGILFGQQGQAFANSLVIPDWFYEGDAVFNETNVSMQGRGRLPFFYNGYRSLWAAQKNYSWMKLRNGSYKDFTPDHYELGYLLLAYGNEKYGPAFWGKVTRDAASFKGLAYPFQRAVKKYSGTAFPQFRRDALNYFKSAFDNPGKEATRVKKHFVADEEFPAYIGDDSIILVRSTYKKIPAFVIRTKNGDQRLRARDVSLDRQFSYRNGKLVYASYRPDIRWGWRNYGEIQLMDVNTGTQKRLTKRSKYFSPDISEDGTTIVAVETDPAGKTALHLVDAGNGMLIKEVPNPDGLYYTYPKFYNGSQVLTAVRNRLGQMSLAMIDAASGQAEYLLPFSYQVLGFPVIQHDTAFFTASFKKNDVLMAYSFNDKKLFSAALANASTRIGMYQPAVSGKEITWSAATAEGLLLTSVGKDALSWTAITPSEWATASETFGIEKINANRDFLASITPGNYQVKKYRKTSGFINFHSLIPLVDDPDYSLTLLGQNILNTLETEVSFLYNRNEQFKQLGFTTTYAGWFPHVSAGGNFTMDRRSLYRGNRVYWNEWEGRGGLNVPLNLSKGRTITGLNIGADYVYTQQQFTGRYKDTFINQSFSYVNSYIVFTNQIQKARKHIYPRIAQSITLQYRNAISDIDRKQFLASGSFYLPGFFSTHNIILSGAMHRRDSTGVPVFSNNFPFSRGYTAENLYRMKKFGINYHIPLLYPDYGFANIVYLLRTRANLFFDYTHIQDFDRLKNEVKREFRSVGTEVFFDTKWWNQLPVSFGFRYSYLLDPDLFGNTGSNRFEIILPVNLIPG
jgi:hypothetical protein